MEAMAASVEYDIHMQTHFNLDTQRFILVGLNRLKNSDLVLKFRSTGKLNPFVFGEANISFEMPNKITRQQLETKISFAKTFCKLNFQLLKHMNRSICISRHRVFCFNVLFGRL